MDTFKNGESVEVETPQGWKPGTYVCGNQFGHVVECPDLWYGAMSMPDTSHIRQVPPVESDLGETQMLFIGGSKTSFKCDARDECGHLCRANCFKKIGHMRYKCNSCGATYTGGE